MMLDVKAEAMARCIGQGLKLILQYDPDINVKDVYGRTPLLTAISLGKKESFNKLVYKFLQPNLCFAILFSIRFPVVDSQILSG